MKNKPKRLYQPLSMNSKLSVLSFLTLISLAGYAQSNTPAVVNSTGSSYVKDGLLLDWSVGEMALTTTMDPQKHQLVITNGFLQSERVSRHQDMSFFGEDEITILPNPTNGRFDVKIETRQQGRVAIDVFNVNGKRIVTRRTANFAPPLVEKFDLTGQPAGTYLIQVTLTPLPGSSGKTGLFRIVKI